jgi:hypothetical protein
MRWPTQRGQSMVEYTVILMALTLALLAPWGSRPGSPVGVTENDQGSLLKAVADKHRGHGYAVSLSEIPETDQLADLADYYERLDKYPELTPQLKTGAAMMNKFSNQLTSLSSMISKFKAVVSDPKQAIKDNFPPKIQF